MSTLIGGFFSTLDIVTNAGSFKKAQAAMFSITEEGKRAADMMDELQEKFRKAGGAGAFSGGGGRGVPPGGKQLALPAPESSPQQNAESPEEEKRGKQSDRLAKLAALYAAYKIIQMVKDLIVSLAKLTYAMTQANMKAVTSSVQANMTPAAIKMWSIAASMNAQDASDMISRFVDFNKAFAELKIGRGDAFGAYAQDISLLAKGSGIGLDSTAMIGMTNDERVKKIFEAAKEYAKKDMQTAIRLLDNLLGPGAVGIMINDLKSGKNSLSAATGATLVTPNATDVKVGQEFGLLKEELDELWKQLGQSLGRQFYDEVKRFNDWFRANKDKIRAAFDAFAKALNVLLDVFRVLFEAFAWFGEQVQRLADFMEKWIPNLNTEQGRIDALDLVPETSGLYGWSPFDQGRSSSSSDGRARGNVFINITVTDRDVGRAVGNALNQAAGRLPE